MMKPLWGKGTSRFAGCRFLFRLQLREQNHVADAFLAEQHHAQAVNADAAGGSTGGVGKSICAVHVGTGEVSDGTWAVTKSTGGVGDGTGGVGKSTCAIADGMCGVAKGTCAVRKSTRGVDGGNGAGGKSTGAFLKSTGDVAQSH
jgi:hypothetical protein